VNLGSVKEKSFYNWETIPQWFEKKCWTWVCRYSRCTRR